MGLLINSNRHGRIRLKICDKGCYEYFSRLLSNKRDVRHYAKTRKKGNNSCVQSLTSIVLANPWFYTSLFLPESLFLFFSFPLRLKIHTPFWEDKHTSKTTLSYFPKLVGNFFSKTLLFCTLALLKFLFSYLLILLLQRRDLTWHFDCKLRAILLFSLLHSLFLSFFFFQTISLFPFVSFFVSF